VLSLSLSLAVGFVTYYSPLDSTWASSYSAVAFFRFTMVEKGGSWKEEKRGRRGGKATRC
jgi:hypothetical protein